MKRSGKEKVEQYRKEFSELFKDFMAQTIGKMLQAELATTNFVESINSKIRKVIYGKRIYAQLKILFEGRL